MPHPDHRPTRRQDPAGRSRLRREDLVRLRLGCGLVCAVLAGAVALFVSIQVHHQRDAAIAEARQQLRLAARLGVDHLAHAVSDLDLVLRTSAALLGPEAGAGNSPWLHRLQTDTLVTHPHAAFLGWTNHASLTEVAGGSASLPPIDTLRATTATSGGLFAGTPYQDSITGAWLLPLWRNLPGRAGAPTYSVLTALTLDRALGEVMPALWPQATVRLTDGQNHALVVNANAHAPEADMLTVREPAPLGLQVITAIPQDVALAGWRSDAQAAFAGAVAIELLVFGAGALAYRNMRRRFVREVAAQRVAFRLRRSLLERERALDQARAELARMSYSVSHDLRAPLRAINGFSHALAEDYGAVLDQRARQYLQRVQRASNRMGELIDGLLELARLSRWEVSTGSVDLSAMARDIAATLAAREPQARVEFDIAGDLAAPVDPVLARQLLTHLMTNAWKFSLSAAKPRVSFGSTQENGETVYFVDDNGVGFDMAHANKLFSPFERLHPGSTAEGSGIGLAAVKRIIELHGGRAWVDAVPSLGVTVFFTLSPTPGEQRLDAPASAATPP